MNSFKRNRTPGLHKQICWVTKPNESGQALVEFTLIFIILLVLAWIPADFGLGFYTAQLAQNASREGARIAAADTALANGTTWCDLPCAGEVADSVLKETAERVSSALLTEGRVTLNLEAGTGCNRQVTVTVNGNYNHFFFQLLNYFGASVDGITSITRETKMRWEHGAACVSAS
jgi:Flp pilus assembly protein TadG